MSQRMSTSMESRRGWGTSPDPISNVRPDPSERRLLTGTSLPIDLCVTAALDALAGVTLPRRTTEALANDAPVIPSAIDVPTGENGDHTLPLVQLIPQASPRPGWTQSLNQLMDLLLRWILTQLLQSQPQLQSNPAR